MTDQHPTKAEVLAAAQDLYWVVSRFADDNRGAPAVDSLWAALDVELDDIVRRLEAVPVCDFCEEPACRCGQGERA